jgi:hypothetical protein
MEKMCDWFCGSILSAELKEWILTPNGKGPREECRILVEIRKRKGFVWPGKHARLIALKIIQHNLLNINHVKANQTKSNHWEITKDEFRISNGSQGKPRRRFFTWNSTSVIRHCAGVSVFAVFYRFLPGASDKNYAFFIRHRGAVGAEGALAD